MKKNISILIIAIIVALGAGFFGGLQYQKLASKNAIAKMAGPQGFNRDNFNGAVSGQRNRAGAGFTSGTILSKNDNSLTVKLAAGGSEIVFLGETTEIMKSAAGTLADLNVGEQVVVSGTANSDGSITAKTVQLGTGQPNAAQGQMGQVPPTPGK